MAMSDADAENLVVARLGRVPQDALEAAVALEAWGGLAAEEALACIAGCNIDVLLTDVRLPGMSGIDLARQLLALRPRVHVIFASGYGAAATANVGFYASSLAKPYDIEQLQALLTSFG